MPRPVGFGTCSRFPTLAFRDAEQAVKLIADEPQRVLKGLLRHD